MKKIIKLISLLLSVVLLFGVTACSKSKDQESDRVVINDFEVFDRDIQLINVFNRFGRLEQNTDAKFVKSGENSLHIQPFGGRIINNTANPFMVIPTVSTRFSELAYGDFSKVDTVSFWLYNKEEYEYEIGIGFQAGKISSSKDRPRLDLVKRTPTEYYTVKSGWNFIEYKVNTARLKLHGLNLEEVLGIAIEFDYVWSNDFNDAPDLYMDQLSIKYTDEERPTELEVPIKKQTTADGRDSFVICDFETPGQSWYFFTGTLSSAIGAGSPVVKQVFAGDYGAVCDLENSQALLIQKKHGAQQYAEYIGMFMYGEIMKAAIDFIGEDIVNHPENYVFCMDVFNGSSVTDSMSLAFINTEKIKDYSSTSITTKAKEWNYFTYHSNFKAMSETKSAIDNQLPSYVSDPGYVRFAWSGYAKSGDYADRYILIDNIRIEKVVAE